MNVVDELVVRLGIDRKDYIKGQQEAQQSMGKTREASTSMRKNLDEDSKKIGEGFHFAKTKLLGFLAALVGARGIEELGKMSINNAASLKFLSDNLGISTQKLQEFQQASALAGGSQQGMLDQLQESAGKYAEWKLGQRDDPVFKQFAYYAGIAGVNIAGAFKSPLEFLLRRSDVIAALYKKSPQEAALAASQMGISSGEFNYVKQGGAAMLRMADAQKDSSTLTAAQADKALKAKQAIQSLGFALSNLAQQITINLLPAIRFMTDGIQDWVGILGPSKQKTSEQQKNEYVPYNSKRLVDRAEFLNQDQHLPKGLLSSVMLYGEKTPKDAKTGTYATSSAGAKGLMQFMPKTWQMLGGGDIENPGESLWIGAKYLKSIYASQGHNLEAAIAMYNGGTKAAQAVRAGHLPNARVLDYIKRVEGGMGIKSFQIGNITIQTQATDAKGIARDLHTHLQRYATASKADTGLQ